MEANASCVPGTDLITSNVTKNPSFEPSASYLTVSVPFSSPNSFFGPPESHLVTSVEPTAAPDSVKALSAPANSTITSKY